jgi:hypothetical protein
LNVGHCAPWDWGDAQYEEGCLMADKFGEVYFGLTDA